MVPTLKDLIFLILGADGWIAGHLEILLQSECRVVLRVRMENREGVEEVLDRIRSTHVFNCAGCTGLPNIDGAKTTRSRRSEAIQLAL